MRFEVKRPERESRIDEALFGANMEITRRTGWGGLSAQMVANRKFAAEQDAQVCRWQLEGGAEYRPGTDSVCRSGCVRLCAGAELRQTGDWLGLQKQAAYRFSFIARGIAGGVLEAAVLSGEEVLWKHTVPLPEKREACRFSFTADRETGSGTLSFRMLSGTADIEVVSLLPEDSFYGMRRDVLDCLKALGLQELRFPGGCYSEVYDWKDGLLEADWRKPIRPYLYDNGAFLFRNTDGVDCHEIGTNEFMRACQYIGAKPVLSVPIIHGAVSDALDWLEYCNGAEDTPWGRERCKAGFAAPFPVLDWCIGNEIYYFGKEMAEDAGYAAEITNAFIRSMKEKDARISAIVAFCPEREEWNRIYLSAVHEQADKVSLHFYMTDEFKPTFGKITEAMCLAVSEEQFLPLLQETAAQIQAFAGEPMPISLDEWGFTWGQPGNTVSAYVEARLLNCLCREADRYGVKKAMFFHPINEGMVLVEKHACRLDCMGRLLQLFIPHKNARRLTVVEASEAEDVDLAASEQEDGSVYLTAISRRADRAIRIACEGYRIAEVRQLAPNPFDQGGSDYRETGMEDYTPEGLLLQPCAAAGIRLIKIG